jgi:hypothetical protein
MSVSYSLTARQSWSRMVRMLFRPFRLEFWLTLGFAAFLSELLSRPTGGGSSWQMHGPGPRMPEVLRHVAAFLLHPVWGALLLAAVICGVIVGIVLMWLSSRGKFIFLDDVVRERAAIVEPWKRYARLGNSLFAFRLAFNIVFAAIVIGISLPLIPAILEAIAAGGSWRVFLAIFAVWWVAAMVPLLLVGACVHLFLSQFVASIMYRDDLGVLAAWRRFGSLFTAHAPAFIGFALLYLVAGIVVGVTVVLLGFATCCVGFVLIVLPYVGSVTLLPVEVTFRGLGPDFLAQFGTEWSVFAKPQPAPAPAPAAPPGGGPTA